MLKLYAHERMEIRVVSGFLLMEAKIKLPPSKNIANIFSDFLLKKKVA